MRERKGSKDSFSDAQSSIGRNSSDQELKFIYSTKATRTYQNGGISLKQEEILGKPKAWAWKVFLRLPTHSSMLQKVGILPTLVYFHPKGLILVEM